MAVRRLQRLHRTWHTDGRGTEQLSHTYPFVDVLPYGRQEDWQDSPAGWPQSATYDKWLGSDDVAALYGTGSQSSAVPGTLREEFGLPPFAPEFLERSLESLEQALGAK